MLGENRMNDGKKIESKSNRLWGKDLHKEKSTPVHCIQLEAVFKEKWKDLSSEELDKRINIFLVWKIMKNRTTSKFAIHTVLQHLDSPKNVDIFSELKEFISISEKYLK